MNSNFTLPKYKKNIEVKPGENICIRKGLDVRCNPKNGYTVVRLHYTADPEKDNDAFRAEARKLSGTKEKYEQEFEINWEVVIGDLVWTEFTKDHNVKFFKYDSGLPLVETWDPGVWTCCLPCQLTEWGQLRIFEANLNILQDGSKIKFPEHVETYRRFQKLHYPAPQSFIPIMDIAGKAEQVMTEISPMECLTAHYGKQPYNHSLSHHKEDAINLVSRKLLETVVNPETKEHEKAIIIHPDATKVIKTMTVGYKYKEQKDPAAPISVNIDEVHPWEDIADCIIYTVYWAFMKAETPADKRKKELWEQQALTTYESFGI